MAKKENITDVTPEIIEGWKKQYGEVFALEVAVDPEKYEPGTVTKDLDDDIPKITGYLRKPDRKVMNYAVVTLPKSISGAGKAVVKDCWLGGDERLLTDEAYNLAAALQAIELVDFYQSRLKKV
ncbi:hypothetical protein [Dyadobacter frigoris]|uniref:Uncharacterized protein n=1 Tax=Dyadobacter frigoris TaxID=2576211 RepID=A0A4V6BIJ7_9BACT|nr:hypothetical protein [Dyadobacter frigoris]TKT89473.1 hypothetical protein FDK13_24330 [Dyadobacter frigoris]